MNQDRQKNRRSSRHGAVGLPIIIGLLLIGVALPAALKLVQQKQEMRRQAGGPHCSEVGAEGSCFSLNCCSGEMENIGGTMCRCIEATPTDAPRPTDTPACYGYGEDCNRGDCCDGLYCNSKKGWDCDYCISDGQVCDPDNDDCSDACCSGFSNYYWDGSNWICGEKPTRTPSQTNTPLPCIPDGERCYGSRCDDCCSGEYYEEGPWWNPRTICGPSPTSTPRPPHCKNDLGGACRLKCTMSEDEYDGDYRGCPGGSYCCVMGAASPTPTEGVRQCYCVSSTCSYGCQWFDSYPGIGWTSCSDSSCEETPTDTPQPTATETPEPTATEIPEEKLGCGEECDYTSQCEEGLTCGKHGYFPVWVCWGSRCEAEPTDTPIPTGTPVPTTPPGQPTNTPRPTAQPGEECQSNADCGNPTKNNCAIQCVTDYCPGNSGCGKSEGTSGAINCQLYPPAGYHWASGYSECVPDSEPTEPPGPGEPTNTPPDGECVRGDADCDEDVDFLDFSAWRSAKYDAAPANNGDCSGQGNDVYGDTDCNGRVEFIDFSVWRSAKYD